MSSLQKWSILPSDFAIYLLKSKVCLYCSFSWVSVTTESGPLWDCLLDRHHYAAWGLLYGDSNYEGIVNSDYKRSVTVSISDLISIWFVERLQHLLLIALLVFWVEEITGRLRNMRYLGIKNNMC